MLQPHVNAIPAKWLVKYLIKIYFLNLRSTIILFDSQNRNELQIAYLDGIYEVQQETEIAMQIIDVEEMNQTELNEKILQCVDLAAEGFISVLLNPNNFLFARTYAAQKSIQRIKDKHHLYLQDELNVEDFFQSEDLDLFPWHIVICYKNDIFKLWTQKFVGSYDYKKPFLLQQFLAHGMVFQKNITNYYENKMKNMMGRPIKLGSHNYKPYSMFLHTESGKGNADSLNTALQKKDLVFFGSEANICLELCSIWNCTLKVKNYGQDAWGELYENGTSTGIIGGVWKKEVDFGIGSIYNWYNYEFEVSNGIAKSGAFHLTLTITTFNEIFLAVRIMGPGPKRLPQYLTPILPLALNSWIVLGLTIGLSSVILNALRRSAVRLNYSEDSYYENNYFIQSFLDIFAMFVQQSYSKVKFGTRLLIGATLLTALTVENIYSGQLKSLLTVPSFEDPIDTTEKFAKMNWKWGAPAVAWEDTIENSEIVKEKILAKNFEVHNVDELKKFTYTGVWGFAIEKLHSGGFTFNDYIVIDDKINLILVKDDVFFEFTRFIARRRWPLKELLNTLVLWVFESGLYIHWETLYTGKYIDSKVLHYIMQSEGKFIPKPKPEILNISHISGPIFALFLGYILSLFVFICEMVAERVKFNRYGLLTCK